MLSSADTDAIANALEKGQKIEAIKIYRDATGEPLKESKEFIERLISELREKDPERFSALSRHKMAGCGTALMLLCLGLPMAVVLVWALT